MASTQTRIRRGTSAQVAAMTPASSEVVHNTTDNRLHVGDGSTAGGIPLPNYNDIQKQSFTTGTVAGTADVITLTLAPAPASYVANMAIEFKASGTNTTGVTINVNGLGAKAIQTVKAGVLSALVAGDLISGVVYRCTYDGTQFQLIGASGGTTQASTSEVANQSVVTKYISPDRLRYAPMVAKAFLNANNWGSGSVAIAQSFNVASVNSSGRITFTNAMTTTNYIVVAFARDSLNRPVADFAFTITRTTGYVDIIQSDLSNLDVVIYEA